MEMVRRFFIQWILLLSVFFSGCRNEHHQRTDSLFKPQSIQDTLDYLMFQIDRGLEEQGNPIICFITIYERNDLCMVDFDVEAGGLLWPLKDSCATSVFSMGRYGEGLLWIGGNPKFKRLITKQLKLSNSDKLLLKNKKELMLKEHLILSNLHREYHFIPPDSLSLIGRSSWY